jgi:hypothetical protein
MVLADFTTILHQFLAPQISRVRYVITTDVKDVVFQLNPSEWLDENMQGAQLVAASEAVKVGVPLLLNEP